MDPQSRSRDLSDRLKAYIEREVERLGTTAAVRPSHRVKFSWPPHPVSYSYHVLTSDWSGESQFEAYGEIFPVRVARTPFGVFGRAESIWHEERGDTEEEMLANLRTTSEPLFKRQRMIARTLEEDGREVRQLEAMEPFDWLRLLYCPDRDVANDAHWIIERHSDRAEMLESLLVILHDRRHPYRRSAQWCVLDLFEDLPAFVKSEEDERRAVEAIAALLSDAEDDYARTVYKAGVVLGGHLPHRFGADALLSSLASPSRIGRRSAIHALFHVVEWIPERRDAIVEALRAHAKVETDPQLKRFTTQMALSLENGETDHAAEPTFPEELAA